MLLAEQSGFQNVSVAAIARQAGVAIGILNYHFGSKQQLLSEMMSDRMQDFVSRLSPRVEGDDFFAYEVSLLRSYLEFLHANPSYVRLAEEVRHHAPDLYRQGLDLHISGILDRIKTGIDQGDLRVMSDEEMLAQAYLLQGAYSFLDRFLEDENYPGDDALLNATENLLKGAFQQPKTGDTA